MAERSKAPDSRVSRRREFWYTIVCVGWNPTPVTIFEQFPIKTKCLAFYWSAANSARQGSQSSQGLQIQDSLKIQNF